MDEMGGGIAEPGEVEEGHGEAESEASAVSLCLQKQSRISPKDCHSLVSELRSLWEGHVSTFFHKWKK